MFIFTVEEKEIEREDEDGELLLRWPPPTRGGRRCFFFVFFESSFSSRKFFRIFFFKEEEEEFERSRSSPMREPRRGGLRGKTDCEHDDARILRRRRRRGNEKKKPSDRLPVDRESKLMGFETVRGESPRGWRGVVARLRARRLLVRAENILRLPSGEMFTNERESS